MKRTNIFDRIYSTVGSGDLEYEYLAAVFGYLDALLEEKMLRFQLAGQDPKDRFRGLYLKDADALNTLKLGFGNEWGSEVELPADPAKIIAKMKERALNEKERVESTITPRLLRIKHLFALSEFEWWSFILIAAPAFDLRYERVFGYLQDNVNETHASLDLIIDLFKADKRELGEVWGLLDEGSNLRQAKLAAPDDVDDKKQPSKLRRSFHAEENVVTWILSGELPNGVDHLERVTDADEQNELLARHKLPAVEILRSVRPWINIHGTDATRARLAAIEICSALSDDLVTLTFDEDQPRTAKLEAISRAIRDAKLLGAVLFVRNIDELLAGADTLPNDCANLIASADGPVLLGSDNPFKLDADTPNGAIAVMRVEIAPLDSFERLDLWKLMIEDARHEIDEEALTSMAGQFDLSSGQIVLAANAAMARALQAERGLRVDDLVVEARLQSGHALGELATKIEPRYDWEDLVLPESEQRMLKDMVSMARNRPLVLEKWGLGNKLASGSGVSALFAGPPGTGKTLAAQIMARQLGIDLYRIDLSTVVSKFVGETEKNLERLFDEAAQSNAMLFFDEADTIFGKRSEVKDAQDRYANLEVGYLLQRMESYSGVAILATNLRANLDDAFTRRLHFIVSFPMPEEEDRLRIWKVLIPPEMPIEADADLSWLARHIKLAGGNIRNILMGAAYIAAGEGSKVAQKHLLRSARRELEKMGRLVNDKDLPQLKDLER